MTKYEYTDNKYYTRVKWIMINFTSAYDSEMIR